jgi:hypothetical protein
MAQAITSLHKDHYENIYCGIVSLVLFASPLPHSIFTYIYILVLAGQKIFTILPPTDRMALVHKDCPVMCYRQVSPHEWTIEPDDGLRVV